MPSIAERYRPRTLDDFCGNAKAVQAVRFLLRQGLGGRALWVSGSTGIGKSALGGIIAHTLAADVDITEYDSADQVNATELARLSGTLAYRGMGPTGARVVVVNEAHGLRGPIMRQMLGLLERLPSHVTIIFTTTRDGQALLFDDIDGRPLVDRCTRIPLTTQGLSGPFTERFLTVAAREGFNVPASKARDLLAESGNSLRAALEWLGTPQSMTYLQAAETAAA